MNWNLFRYSCFVVLFFSPLAKGNAGFPMCLLFSLFCPDAWCNFPLWLARPSRMAKHSFVFSTRPELSAPTDTGSLPGVTFKCWSNKIGIYVEQRSCVCSQEPGVMRKRSGVDQHVRSHCYSWAVKKKLRCDVFGDDLTLRWSWNKSVTCFFPDVFATIAKRIPGFTQVDTISQKKAWRNLALHFNETDIWGWGAYGEMKKNEQINESLTFSSVLWKSALLQEKYTV